MQSNSFIDSYKFTFSTYLPNNYSLLNQQAQICLNAYIEDVVSSVLSKENWPNLITYTNFYSFFENEENQKILRIFTSETEKSLNKFKDNASSDTVQIELLEDRMRIFIQFFFQNFSFEILENHLSQESERAYAEACQEWKRAEHMNNENHWLTAKSKRAEFEKAESTLRQLRKIIADKEKAPITPVVFVQNETHSEDSNQTHLAPFIEGAELQTTIPNAIKNSDKEKPKLPTSDNKPTPESFERETCVVVEKYNSTLSNISTVENNKRLAYAVKTNDVRLVKALLENNIKVSDHLLQIACSQGQLAIARLLIVVGMLDVDKKNAEGKTLLHLATKNRHWGVARLLIQEGADVNQSDDQGYTALHYVMQSNDVDVIETFISIKGIILYSKNNNGNIPLNLIKDEKTKDVIKRLLRKEEIKRNVVKANIFDGTKNLHIPSHHGHHAEVKELLSKGADINRSGKNGKTALHLAAEKGHADVVQTLLENGALIKQDAFGDLPSFVPVENSKTSGYFGFRNVCNMLKPYETAYSIDCMVTDILNLSDRYIEKCAENFPFQANAKRLVIFADLATQAEQLQQEAGTLIKNVRLHMKDAALVSDTNIKLEQILKQLQTLVTDTHKSMIDNHQSTGFRAKSIHSISLFFGKNLDLTTDIVRRKMIGKGNAATIIEKYFLEKYSCVNNIIAAPEQKSQLHELGR